MAYGEGNIRVGPDSDIVEGANECTVGGPGLPRKDFRGNRDGFVRPVEYKASNHRSVAGISIRKVEPIHNLVDEGGLQ